MNGSDRTGSGTEGFSYTLSDDKTFRNPAGCCSPRTIWMRMRVRLSGEPQGIDRRQRVRHACPAVALVLADPQAACRRPESQSLAGFVERKRVAIDDVVGVRLRQACGQGLKAFAAVVAARDDQLD